MAEDRTLGLSLAREANGEDASKEALQRRMEQARDSISNTVTEIKENVTQQYETVKEALDWREHYKKAPVAWSLGAAGVGFFVGYGIAACVSGDDYDKVHYSASAAHPLTASPYLPQGAAAESFNPAHTKSNGKDDGPGMLDRIKETSAYERLSKETGALGDRLVEELSITAQTIVLPALLKKIKTWIGVDLYEKPALASGQQGQRVSNASSFEQAREF
jgi:hypothetical protein